MAGNNLGPMIRLWGVKASQLPSGPLVKVGAGAGAGDTKNKSQSDDDNDGNNRDGRGNKSAQGTSNSKSESAGRAEEELANFLSSLLQEAVPFIDSVAPKRKEKQQDSAEGGMNKRARRVWKSKGSKSYSETINTKVDLFERVISSKELEVVAPPPPPTTELGKNTEAGGETWICRRSIHEDKQEQGTASWDEFRNCFKERHPETEALFTPSVVKMDKRVVWDCGGVPPQQLNNETYSNFTLCVLEARHRVGKPLKDRTFPILQMTCSAVDTSSLTPAAATSTDKTQHQPVHGHKEKKEFLVISVTVPDYFHSSSFRKDSETHHVGNAETHHPVEKDTVIASYASIERIRQVDLSGEEDRTGKIEWLMALTSDARGILPRWIQNLAVPGQIAKDVPLFLGWIGKERKNEGRFKDEGRRDEKKEKTRKIGK